MVAYLFAGQGAQYIGMGKDLYEAFPESKAVFDKADKVLGFSLSKLCFEGPQQELTRTANCQPAVLTMSIAAFEAFKRVTRSPCFAGRQAGHQVTSLDILDVGTGSGCIAISLAKLLPYAAITATDISDKALAAAMENADLNGAKVNFVQGDLFCGLPPGSYDLVVSNPPYIPSPEIQNLQPEIRHEPIVALDGGSDGLDFYRRMIKDAPQYLKENSYFIMEIGFNQKDSIKDIFQKNKNFKVIDIVQDYNNIDRIIIAKREDRWIN